MSLSTFHLEYEDGTDGEFAVCYQSDNGWRGDIVAGRRPIRFEPFKLTVSDEHGQYVARHCYAVFVGSEILAKHGLGFFDVIIISDQGGKHAC